MGKCTIIIEDTEDGGFNSHVSFDPELESEDGKEFACTTAQKVGWELYERLVEETDGQPLEGQ